MLRTEYASYLDACNRRDWTVVASFLTERLAVNGEASSAADYLAGLISMCVRHPDHQWQVVEVRQARDLTTVSLTTSRGSEHGVEFAQYRGGPGTITEVWTNGSLPG